MCAQSKSLHACSKQCIQSIHTQPRSDLHSTDARLMNFNEFNDAAVKNRVGIMFMYSPTDPLYSHKVT